MNSPNVSLGTLAILIGVVCLDMLGRLQALVDTFPQKFSICSVCFNSFSSFHENFNSISVMNSIYFNIEKMNFYSIESDTARNRKKKKKLPNISKKWT
jgi:hypothetical protein